MPDQGVSIQKVFPCVETHTPFVASRHELCILFGMSSDSKKCPVCGGTMSRVKVLPSKLGHLTRYRCTCGHCEDLKESSARQEAEAFVLEGFQEIP